MEARENNFLMQKKKKKNVSMFMLRLLEFKHKLRDKKHVWEA
jgi:hypothetical protein